MKIYLTGFKSDLNEDGKTIKTFNDIFDTRQDDGNILIGKDGYLEKLQPVF